MKRDTPLLEFLDRVARTQAYWFAPFLVLFFLAQTLFSRSVIGVVLLVASGPLAYFVDRATFDLVPTALPRREQKQTASNVAAAIAVAIAFLSLTSTFVRGGFFSVFVVACSVKLLLPIGWAFLAYPIFRDDVHPHLELKESDPEAFRELMARRTAERAADEDGRLRDRQAVADERRGVIRLYNQNRRDLQPHLGGAALEVELYEAIPDGCGEAEARAGGARLRARLEELIHLAADARQREEEQRREAVAEIDRELGDIDADIAAVGSNQLLDAADRAEEVKALRARRAKLLQERKEVLKV